MKMSKERRNEIAWKVLVHKVRKQGVPHLRPNEFKSLVACVGGGSNAMGLFAEFLNDKVQMIGVEPGGKSFKPGDHAATLTLGKPGTLHGMFTYLLQDKAG